MGYDHWAPLLSMKSLFPVFTLVLTFFSELGAEETSRPNILFILTDDQGWPTLESYGGKKVPTPNLNRLAREGAQFNSFYVTSQCSPTRASFLTGQYTARNGLWHVLPWYGYPRARVTEPMFRENLPRDTYTFPKGLQDAGYTTGIAGKWHLTANPQDGYYNGINPEAAHHFGFTWAAPVLSSDEISRPGGDRGVNRLTDDAIEFIRKNRDNPWFFFLSHHMIHGVVVAPETLTQKYRDLGYSGEGPDRAVYLAALEHIDRSIGRLLAALDELGESDETLIIFTSDNGGVDEKFQFRNVDGETPKLPIDIREYDNAPLRMGKGSGYEGGIRVPFLARWPGHIPPNRVIETPAHIVDLAPTFFELAGYSTPESETLDGESLVPLLLNPDSTALQDRPVFQYYPFYDLRWGLTPSASVRLGKYKLIEFFGDRIEDDGQYLPGRRLELYNVADDPGENNNLREAKPNLTKELKNILHEWIEETGARRPETNAHFDSARAFEETREKPEWIQKLRWKRKEP